MQSQKQIQKPKVNTNLDQELDQEYLELQKSLEALNSNIVAGNLELNKQTDELKKAEKDLVKVQNNNSKSIWLLDASKSTWSMLKGLFTKPKLVKEPNDAKQPEEVDAGTMPELSSNTGDRKENLVNLAQSAKNNATLQNKAIKDSTQKIDDLKKREDLITIQQKKMNTKMDKL